MRLLCFLNVSWMQCGVRGMAGGSRAEGWFGSTDGGRGRAPGGACPPPRRSWPARPCPPAAHLSSWYLLVRILTISCQGGARAGVGSRPGRDRPRGGGQKAGGHGHRRRGAHLAEHRKQLVVVALAGLVRMVVRDGGLEQALEVVRARLLCQRMRRVAGRVRRVDVLEQAVRPRVRGAVSAASSGFSFCGAGARRGRAGRLGEARRGLRAGRVGRQAIATAAPQEQTDN